MKKQVRIVKKGKDNIAYWRSLTAKERLKKLEEMRQEIINAKYGTQQKFQSVYSITKRK
jgi:hypothetical protein